jgi:predicted nuclease of predicted toxin-antitoxin system
MVSTPSPANASPSTFVALRSTSLPPAPTALSWQDDQGRTSADHSGRSASISAVKAMWIDFKAEGPDRKELQQWFEFFRRKAKARFYADENFPEQAVSLLRVMGAKVQTNHQAGLRGHSDQDQLAYARRNGLVLVTCDRDFLNERSYPLVHCPAIFVVDFGSGSFEEMKQAFNCFAAVFRTPQFY